ncbi:kinase-like domain-containing protein [Rhodocollybia butyracea]|uniref:non-specific serine/threonine protein kinase n=1 Tax=Rhodocollybia butyracea TaxID=206335 RepID=A0A9P5PT81_9AGAR|nr:kinase-like domain-containing protein [Rhodocollybia butyracea]
MDESLWLDANKAPYFREGDLYYPSDLLSHENLDHYTPGGFHPIMIGDEFSHGRYRIIHKLGYGGFSTTWLARDQHKNILVALKALRASASGEADTVDDIIRDVVIPQNIHSALPTSDLIRPLYDSFVVEGPNGLHRILIHPFAGPSIHSILMESLDERVKLRGDLARKLAKQMAMALYDMHRLGFVHGDLTTSNILFRVIDPILGWSDAEVYHYLGDSLTLEVKTTSGDPCGPHVPRELVEPVDHLRFFEQTLLLQESIVVIDFGQSYEVASPPKNYRPGTKMNYTSPEALYDNRAGMEADVWALGCAIYEIRTGYHLFTMFAGDRDEILGEIFRTLGKPPDAWWKTEGEGWTEPTRPCPIHKRVSLAARGIYDAPVYVEDGLHPLPITEVPEVRMDEKEVDLLTDLLEKMIRYRPEERITMEEVISHPWFNM